MKTHENRISNNTKPMGNKLTVLKISPIKTGSGAIRKTKSDLSQKVKKKRRQKTHAFRKIYKIPNISLFPVLHFQKTSHRFSC